MPVLAHTSPRLSQRLQALIKKYDAETFMGYLTAGTPTVIQGNGVVFKLTKDWGTPFNFDTGNVDKIPEVKFRNGEVGIVEGEIYAKDGTEALVSGNTYVYTNHQWVSSLP